MQNTKRIIARIVYTFTILFLVWQCHNYVFFGKKNPLKTHVIGNGIFEERFASFRGGVLMSDTYTYYLTDSTTFRKYIGDCDEDELYRCNVYRDTIKAVKYSRSIHYGKETPTDSVFFSLKALKKEGEFE